jgi:hypothetical protein
MCSENMSYLFCLRTFNNTLDMAYAAAESSVSLFKAVGNWITGYNKQWFFITNRSIPVPASSFTQFEGGLPVNVSWVFNQETNTLSSIPYSSVRQRLRCLSVHVVTDATEDSLDAALHGFTLYIHNELPPPTILAACCSIKNSIWQSPVDDPILSIIDRDGEEHRFNMFGEYDEKEWEIAIGIQAPAPAPVPAETEEAEEGGEAEEAEEEGEEGEEGVEGEAEEGAEGEVEEGFMEETIDPPFIPLVPSQ